MTLFLVLGLCLIVIGAFFLRQSIHHHEREGIIGSTTLIVAGLILTILFGVFYRVILTR